MKLLKSIFRIVRFVSTIVYVIPTLLRLLFWKRIVNGYVVISPSKTLSGAPLLSCAIYDQIKLNYPVCYLSVFGGGEVQPDTNTFFCMHGLRSKILNKIIAFVIYKKGYRNVYCNSILSSEYILEYKKVGFFCVSLIHEMRSAINYFQLSEKIDHIADSSDYIIFSSNLTYADFLSFSENKNKLKLKSLFMKQGLYNTTISDNIFQKDNARTKFRKSLGISLNSKVILGIGDDLERKGFKYFFRLAERANDCIFVWVTASLIPQECRIDNLIAIPPVNHNQMFALYFSADLFFLSSIEDPFPSVILEAMSAGLPVISIKGSGGADEIINKYTGLCIDKDNLSLASNFLDKFDNNAANKYFRYNTLFISKKYNFRKYVEGLTDLAQ